MRASWKLGRISGIDVYLHSTFLLLLLFTGIGPGILLLALVFGCVLLHELGHALAARRFGIGTTDITLYPIGGVARLSRLPKAPGAELVIALAGPAVNFAIVATLLLVDLVLGVVGRPPIVEEIFGWLITINLSLGLFNLIPAFPMDGGRVLRAALSGWLGRVRATSVAATIGRTLAIIFGTISLFGSLFGVGGESAPSLVHVALAMFIYFAASAEEAYVIAEDRSRSYEKPGDGSNPWAAPPGFHWVQRGNGLWQLAPLGAAPMNAHSRTSQWP